MAGLKVYELTNQGSLLSTDWVVIQRGTDPAKKTEFKTLLADLYWTDGNKRVESTSLGVTINGARIDIIDSGAGTNEGTSIYFNNLDRAEQARIRPISKTSGSDLLFYTSDANTAGNTNLVLTLKTDLNSVFAGTVTATGFIPFTGCHIAKANQDLKLGELVSLNSYGKCTSKKQPDWFAKYCKADQKGNFGIVYDIRNVDIMEDYDSEEEVGLTKTIKVIEVQKIDGVYTAVEVEKEEPILIDVVVANTNNQKIKVQKTEVRPCVKQRKIGEELQYLIACIGDAGGITGVQVTSENGNLECGDYLVPSDKEGFAKKSLSEFVPLNHCGKIGEDVIFEEGEMFRVGCAWIKE